MKEILTSVYVILPICVVAVILGIYVIRKSTKILMYNKLSDISNKDASYIFDIIANEYSVNNVIKDVKIISESAVEESITAILPSSDIVFIGKCGVILITIITNKGEFDNPKTGDWRYRYKNSAGEIVIEDKVNPFDATIPQIRVISELLKNERVNNNCIKRLVVYTQSKIRFTYDYKEVVSVDNLLSTLEEYNKKQVLTSAEIRLAYDAIVNYSEYLKSQSL